MDMLKLFLVAMVTKLFTCAAVVNVPLPMLGPTPRHRPLRIPSSLPIRYRRTNILGNLDCGMLVWLQSYLPGLWNGF